MRSELLGDLSLHMVFVFLKVLHGRDVRLVSLFLFVDLFCICLSNLPRYITNQLPQFLFRSDLTISAHCSQLHPLEGGSVGFFVYRVWCLL